MQEPSAITTAVPNIDIDIHAKLGSFQRRYCLRTSARTIGIAGASGAGKSVLLKVLAGVERTATGRVAIHGAVWQLSAERIFVRPWLRHVGWMPQDALLFPHRSVRDNLGAAAQASDDEIEPMAQMLGVSHLLNRAPRYLSGGERQRVALGRALLARPTLLLLDEPFSALDFALRDQVTERLRLWLSQREILTLLVSHDRIDLARLCDETIELSADLGERS